MYFFCLVLLHITRICQILFQNLDCRILEFNPSVNCLSVQWVLQDVTALICFLIVEWITNKLIEFFFCAGAGADFVMLGGMLAGHDQSGT